MAIVLRVSQALHVEETHFGRRRRERTPMPRTSVQHERFERFKSERSDGVNVAHVVESHRRWSHRNHSRLVEDHERLRMCVVAIEHFATESSGGYRNLGSEVPDHVDVGVVPLEDQAVLPIPGVRICDRNPAEWGPRFPCEPQRNDRRRAASRRHASLARRAPSEALGFPHTFDPFANPTHRPRSPRRLPFEGHARTENRLIEFVGLLPLRGVRRLPVLLKSHPHPSFPSSPWSSSGRDDRSSTLLAAGASTRSQRPARPNLTSESV